MNQRKPWRPDLGLLIFIIAGVAITHVTLGLVFGHLDSAALAACVIIGVGIGTLLHYVLSQRRPRA
jgi:putative flippase GtrA